MEGGREGKRLTVRQREGDLEEEEQAKDREVESSSRHHKVEVVMMSLGAKGAEKRGEERGERGSGDVGERREREDDAMGDEEREGEEERRSLQDMLDRERHSFRQRERRRRVRVSLAIPNCNDAHILGYTIAVLKCL